jgi:hypothetical protein
VDVDRTRELPVKTYVWLVFLVVATGCYDFRKDFYGCVESGKCKPPPGSGPISPGELPIVTAPVCSSSGWCWQTPLPHNSLNSTVSFSETDAWAFGDRGFLTHFDGTTWSFVAGATANLGSALAFGPNDIFVASDAGLLHWDGAAWNAEFAGQTIYGVAGVSAADLWVIVGTWGELRHRAGGAWAKVDHPKDGAFLTGIYAATANAVWAIGDGGLILYWNGTAWTEEGAGLSTRRLNGIWGASEADVWVVGSNSTILRRYNGTWQDMNLASGTEFNAVSGSGASDVWMVGLGTASATHWNGTTLELEALGAECNAYGVAVRPGATWAVGCAGTITRREGNTWVPFPNGLGRALLAVHGTSATDVWAVGEGSQTLHFDGTRWMTGSAGGRAQLNTVFAVSKDEVWVAEGVPSQTDALVRRRTAAGWQAMTPASPPIYGLWASSANDVWAVGEAGLIYHYDGTGPGMVVVASGTSKTLKGVWGTAANDVWAVGDSGTLLHWAGGPVWTVESSGTSNDLSAVWASSASEVWVTGHDVLKHRTGATWEDVPGGPGSDRVAVTGDTTGVWFVGEYGAIGHGTASVASASESGTRSTLRGIWAAPTGEVFAVGERGALLRHAP